MKQVKYKNGQVGFELKGATLTYFFKDGTVKAFGPYKKDMMEGKWTFYREGGQLWGIGNFKNSKKHGIWIRYDKKGKLEYKETFKDNKIAKGK